MKKINKSFYASVHYWLKYNYGVANRCDGKDCNHKSANYSWALLKGCKYEYKRDNFIQLCYSCHAKYDATEEGRQRLIKINTGKTLSDEQKRKISKRNIGHKVSDETRIKIGLALKGKSNSLKGRKKPPVPEEVRNRISATRKIRIKQGLIKLKMKKGRYVSPITL